jgi:hypothetical protein
MVGLLLNLCVLLFGLYTKKRRVWFTSIPIVINAVAFFINIFAPGNAVRKAYFVQMEPIAAVKAALQYMFVAQYEWFTIIILLLTVLAIPICWKMIEKTEFLFPLPGIVFLLSFLCCAAMATPSFYATSEEPLARVVNVIRLAYHLLLFINVFYLIGWFQKRKKLNVNPKISLGLLFLIGILGVINYHTTEIPQREYITYGAYCSYITGEAQTFHQEYLEREELLNSDQTVVTLKSFSVKPFPFWTYDISEDPSDWKNQAVAAWYKKQSVMIKDEG